jgi:predicted transcriptional regulator
MEDFRLYSRLEAVEKELDEVLKELSQLKQSYDEVLDMLKREKKDA